MASLQSISKLRSLGMGLLVGLLVVSQGCRSRTPPSGPPVTSTRSSDSSDTQQSRLLQESWDSYRKRFIQGDGRVIDWEGKERSTSEGQAYALWRAVFMDDRDTFDRVLGWAESNLQRKDPSGKPTDSLWAWKWGKSTTGQWIQLDQNFASDADIDACFALILASQRWNRPDYLALARTKLKDIWVLSTVTSGSTIHLLPGPKIAFQKDNLVTFNPSYAAPYAFRLFAQVDGDRDWMALVNSSYDLLNQSSRLSQVGLPSDWVNFDLKTGQYSALPSGSPIQTQYSFDATRIWWRVALDAEIFNESRARTYLETYLKPLQSQWRRDRKIPAQIDLQGNPMVNYEATSQYGMLYAAFRVTDPTIAREIYEQKLLPNYRAGFWDDDKAYYTQNLAWFGIHPPHDLAAALQPHFPPAPK